MRITKEWASQQRGKLLDRLKQLGDMSTEDLRLECGRVIPGITPVVGELTRETMVLWCMKWAIHDAFPSSVVD
jgi:hypothetical protein